MRNTIRYRTSNWYFMRFTLLLLFIYFLSFISCNEDNTGKSINFFLYTRDNIDAEILQVDNAINKNNTNFDSNKKTKMLIHGYLDNVRRSIHWKVLCRELLHQGDYNVIIVDWFKLSVKFYAEVVHDVDSIAKKVANLIKYLKDFRGAKPEDFHLIGHSLGAQISGFVGKYISKIGRITGLDPAGPKFQNVPPHLRLDKSDANFVDVIHTDIAYNALVGYGYVEPIGHADFYPNGGNNQATCGIRNLPEEFSLRDIISQLICDHLSALIYFIQSVRRCLFMGIRCTDWKSFIRGECGDCRNKGNCAPMGNNLDSQHIDLTAEYNIFYMKTSSHSPYCSYQYQITLVLAHPKNSTLHISGMYLLLTGNHGELFTVLVSGFTTLRGANSYTYLIISEEYLGIIKRLTFRWVNDSHNNERKTGRKRTRMHLKEIQVLPIQLRTEKKHFCGNNGISLRSNEDMVLEECN